MNTRLSKEVIQRVLKSKTFLVLFTLVTVVVCFYLSKIITINGIAHAQAWAVPFTLDMEVYSYSGTPQQEPHLFIKKTEARRSDGATALIEDFLVPKPGRNGRQITFMDGKSISIVDLVQARTTCVLKNPRSVAVLKSRVTHPPQNCVYVPAHQTFVGNDTVLNQPVAIVRNDIGDRVITKWLALGLSCQTLQYRWEEKGPDGSLRLITEGRPVGLKLEEPDLRLFDEGAGYTEVMPSELVHRQFDRLGLPWDDANQQWGIQADKTHSQGCTQPPAP